MKEKIFYFSWVFIRAVLEIDYTKVCFRTFKFNSYTEDLFNFRVLMYNKYKRSVSNEEARPYAEGTLQSWGLFERLLMMKEFDKVKNFVKTLPDWSNFYIELIRIIKVGDDYKVVGWLKEKGIDLTKMWEPTKQQKELEKKYKFDDVAWEWTNVFIEFLEDEETFGKHHWEYGRVAEYLNRPKFKEAVFDALDKAMLIENLSNRQDLVDHLKTFSDIARTHFYKDKYKKWVICSNNVKWMESWTKSQPQQATCIEQEQLFKDKYRKYFSDIDNFVNMLNKMKGAELREYFNSCLNKSHINLKVFCDDVFKLTPQRLGEKGWNYEAIRKH